MARRGRGRPPHPEILTPAEHRVLGELRRGGTNAEIAVRLGLSPETVRTHIASMLSKLGLADRHQLAAWRPDPERKRLLESLALPPLLGSIGRPLAWAGFALGGLAVLAAIVVLLAVFFGTTEDEHPAASEGAHTATGPCAEPATGGEAQLGAFNGPGTYSVGTYVLIIPEGVQLDTFVGPERGWHGDGETSTIDSQTTAYHYRVEPAGLQVVVEQERRTTTYHAQETSVTTFNVTRTLRDADGELMVPPGFDCSCADGGLSPELRVLATVYCHVDGTDFDHPNYYGQ